MILNILLYFGYLSINAVEAQIEFPSDDLRLVIDHDGGADDAMAIFMAIIYEKYKNGPKIVGITTTHGNVNEDQTFSNTQRILDVAGRRDIPIFRGSNSSLLFTQESDQFFGTDGLGDNENVTYRPIKAQPENAVNSLIDLSKKFEGELIVVAIGPLTNIALAIKLDPMFLGRLFQLYVGAGNVYSNVHNAPEFNALMDVEAYHVVSNSSVLEKVTAIPYSEILSYHDIPMDWRINVLGSIDTKIMQNQNSYERISMQKRDSWELLDPSVMAVVLDNNVIQSKRKSENSIILCGPQRGINPNNFRKAAKSNMYMVMKIYEEKYKNLIFDIFSAELSQTNPICSTPIS